MCAKCSGQQKTKRRQGAVGSIARRDIKSFRWLRVIALMLALALVLSLVPLYLAARYDVAGPDDYRYGKTTHAVYEETHSFGAVLSEAARVTGETYTDWQGSFAAIFLMALQPAIFGEACYRFAPYLLLSVFVLSVFALVLTFSEQLACVGRERRDERPASLSMALLAALALVQCQPATVDAFYWYNGGVYYTFFFSLALLLVALWIRRLQRKSVFQWIAMPVLALLIGGGNLVTAFLMTGLFVLLLLCEAILKKRVDALTVLVLLVLLAAFLVNAFAPGNAVRAATETERSKGALSAVLSALKDAVTYGGRWLLTPPALLTLCIVPLAWRIVPKTGMRFPMPLFVWIGAFLFFAAGFTPTEFALGHAGEDRLINIQYDLFVLLLWGAAVYTTGAVKRTARRVTGKLCGVSAAGLVSVGLLGAFLSLAVTRSGAAVSAARILINGNAASYAEAWQERFELLSDEAETDILLPKLDKKPPLLCTLEPDTDEGGFYYWYNEQIADYYGKTRVLREKSDD